MCNDLWKRLKNADKPIALYGMGNGADKIISVLSSLGIPIAGVFASDGFVRKKEFHGMPVCSYSELKERIGDMIVLLCFGSALPDVIQNIKKIASEQELYAPDVPVYGKTLFNAEYAKQNAEGLKSVYTLLADDISKKTFENTVKYKLSGDISLLFDCEVSPDEPYRSFLKLTDNEVFADLGAYRGDTVADFLRRVNGYSHIYAAEPDKKTFSKLKAATENLSDITLLNACVSDRCGTETFGMSGSRGSAISEKGIEIPSVSADGMGSDISFIKMDIEGNELSAVLGAEKTILKNKPKMIISCYHRSEDLITLPQAVLNIRSDYKLYMRHFPSLPAWDTCYYFI